MLTIENSCNVEPENQQGILLTHHEDKSNHGIGLKSVQKLLISIMVSTHGIIRKQIIFLSQQ